MSTLGEMKASGEGLIFYCKPNGGPACHHSWTPNIDQLIQYFGVDFDVVANRTAFLQRFVCEKCGRRSADIRLVLSSDTPGLNGGQGGHNHQPPMSLEESLERYRAFVAERKRLGIKSNEEIASESREFRKAQARAEKLAEKTGGVLIGPPNPWARRKRGRWL